MERPCSRSFSLLPWTLLVIIGVALFKEGGKTPKSHAKGLHKVGVGVLVQLILAAVKLEIPKPPGDRKVMPSVTSFLSKGR